MNWWDSPATPYLLFVLVDGIVALIVALFAYYQHRMNRKVMAEYAEFLREHGWKGHAFSDSAVEKMMTVSPNLQYMVRLADESVRVAEEERETKSNNGFGA